jgi:hypothetical protein
MLLVRTGSYGRYRRRVQIRMRSVSVLITVLQAVGQVPALARCR